MIVAVDPKYRIVSGGSMKDFDTPQQAANYLARIINIFGHGSMVKVYTLRKNDK